MAPKLRAIEGQGFWPQRQMSKHQSLEPKGRTQPHANRMDQAAFKCHCIGRRGSANPAQACTLRGIHQRIFAATTIIMTSSSYCCHTPQSTHCFTFYRFLCHIEPRRRCSFEAALVQIHHGAPLRSSSESQMINYVFKQACQAS